ncbi:MAG: ArsR family transcriptional regulator [Phycisphaerales bacterium]|jgi:ArsR family transcriptional regulator|nr:ArsR family transcriptional regulator [Phycisphaerales bacterium]
MTTSGSSPTATLLDRLSGLHDVSRLRLLVLLDAHELAVGELAAAIQSPQSTVSRHLKKLLESGWIQRRSVGPQALYRKTRADLDPAAHALWAAAAASLAEDPAHAEDLRRVKAILAERHVDTRAYFGSVGAEWTEVRAKLFGRTIAISWMPALLHQDSIVADLGCGTGQIAAALAPWVARVEAVDREPAMLQAARRRLGAAENVRFHEADLTSLPLHPGSVDLAILSLVLHHLPNPDEVIHAAASLVADGGRVLIIDMARHERSEYRDTMGHLHLGFGESEVTAWCRDAGLSDARYALLPPDPDALGPGLFVATATRHSGSSA